MFRAAKSGAESLSVELQWELVIVDDAGHSNSQVAPAAAKLISSGT